MGSLFKFELDITDDMSMTQEEEAIALLSKAGTLLGAACLIKGRHTINNQAVQALLNGSASLEAAGKNWGTGGGPSPIAIPTMVPPRRV